MAAIKRLRLGLLARIALALAAVGLIPLSIVPYLVRLNREAITDQVLRTHAVAARSTATRIEAFVDSLEQAAGAIALNPTVYSNPRSAAAQELVAGLLQAQPLIVGAVIENAAGDEVLRVQSRARASVVEAVLAAPSERPLLPRRELDTLWLRFSHYLPGDVGRLKLVVEATPLEALLQSEELGREAVQVVASQLDGVIMSSEPGVTLESFAPSMVRAARTGRISGASRFEGGPGGGSLGAYAPLTEIGWYVLSKQPVEVAEEVAAEMQRQASLAVALALLLTTVLSAVAYRSVIRPVRELVQAQRRLARGRAKPASGNEIEQLRAGVSMLERQTLDREAIGRIFLGRYMVMEILGSGGMGTVFKGWDPKLQRHVALKTVHLDEQKKPDTHAERQSSLMSEAVTLARLNHPNVVAVYDVEDSGQVAFIAMQFVDGTNLDRLLGRVGSLSVEQAVPLAAAIAHGLAAAHSHGVVHRDVKPGNVLLGKDGSIKVTDFGIAGHVTAAVKDAVVFGTPGYMPPEVLRGAKFEPGGDLFALGVVLYECLAGLPPFGVGDPQETIIRTQTAAPPPLRARSSAVTPELEAFTLGLLEKDPAARSPSSAAAAGEKLEAMARVNGWQWSAPSTLTGAETDDWRAATEAVFVPFDPSADK